ncbi:hypothetical protein C2S53_012859 [Perilla frutescens var. hirtella]|uniref:Uncharacterized protein n=1 Tax=Perilla frutescens var. hirtella TaxID=608512 RepID=A0AAD4IRJ6_PERFH|nr:hypothetical protein C2S53_012859 [Perilla frutescens var. hirtella]
MATASFKSTSRRGAATEPKAPPPSAAARWRSQCVSAVSRKTHIPFDDNNASVSTKFSNNRDNPLFWSRSSSPPDKEESGKIREIPTGSSKSSPNLNVRNGNESSNSAASRNGDYEVAFWEGFCFDAFFIGWFLNEDCSY